MAPSSVTMVVLVLVLAAFTASCRAVLPVNPYATVQFDSVDDDVDVDSNTATVVAADADDGDDVEAAPAWDDEKLKAVKRTQALLEQVVARNKVRARVRAWRRKNIMNMNMGMEGEKDLNNCIGSLTNVIGSIGQIIGGGGLPNILGQISSWISSVTGQCASAVGGAGSGSSGSAGGPAQGGLPFFDKAQQEDDEDNDKAALKKDIYTVVAALHSLRQELNIPAPPTFVNQLHF